MMELDKMTPDDRNTLYYASGLLMGLANKYGEADVLIYHFSIRIRIDIVPPPKEQGQ